MISIYDSHDFHSGAMTYILAKEAESSRKRGGKTWATNKLTITMYCDKKKLKV